MVLPSSLLTSLRTIEGFDETSFVEAHQQPAPVSIRFNPVKWNTAYADARLKGGAIDLFPACLGQRMDNTSRIVQSLL